MPYPGPALPGPQGHSCPVTDVKREAVPARMRPIENPNWSENVVTDGRLITGQNPASAHGVGVALLNALRQPT